MRPPDTAPTIQQSIAIRPTRNTRASRVTARSVSRHRAQRLAQAHVAGHEGHRTRVRRVDPLDVAVEEGIEGHLLHGHVGADVQRAAEVLG